MTKKWSGIAIILLLGGLVSWVWAQGGPDGKRRYDPSTVTTITGTVEEVTQHAGPRGGTGTHLLVKTASGTVAVHVGPTSYLAKQQFGFAKGDAAEVTGSRVTMGGTDTILAREIKKDGKTLALRDAQGLPNWRGGRNR